MKNIRPVFSRALEIRRMRWRLERDGFPRLQMLLLVTLTGAAGFVASRLLLHAGVVDMWVRYLAAFGFAWLAFLGLLWLWLRTRAQDYADLPDLSGLWPSSSPQGGDTVSVTFGNGGDFAGGGASASFDAPAMDLPATGNAGEVGKALSGAVDADELVIPLIVIALLGTLVLSALFMVWSAPALFAELLVDGVLSASLYRRLRGLETRHWLETAIRRTAGPFVVTAAVVSACGWGMALYAPEAHSIGEVVRHARLAGHDAARP